MDFWYVRHGLSKYNKMGLFCGSTDAPLANEGVEQAKEAGLFLKEQPIKWIISSPQKRAVHTAAEISKQTGVTVLKDYRLKEYHMGVLEGQKYYPIDTIDWSFIEGAENNDAFYNRIFGALKDASQKEGLGIIVAHGCVSRIVKQIQSQDRSVIWNKLPTVANGAPQLININPEVFNDKP